MGVICRAGEGDGEGGTSEEGGSRGRFGVAGAATGTDMGACTESEAAAVPCTRDAPSWGRAPW